MTAKWIQLELNFDPPKSSPYSMPKRVGCGLLAGLLSTTALSAGISPWPGYSDEQRVGNAGGKYAIVSHSHNPHLDISSSSTAIAMASNFPF